MTRKSAEIIMHKKYLGLVIVNLVKYLTRQLLKFKYTGPIILDPPTRTKPANMSTIQWCRYQAKNSKKFPRFKRVSNRKKEFVIKFKRYKFRYMTANKKIKNKVSVNYSLFGGSTYKYLAQYFGMNDQIFPQSPDFDTKISDVELYKNGKLQHDFLWMENIKQSKFQQCYLKFMQKHCKLFLMRRKLQIKRILSQLETKENIILIHPRAHKGFQTVRKSKKRFFIYKNFLFDKSFGKNDCRLNIEIFFRKKNSKQIYHDHICENILKLDEDEKCVEKEKIILGGILLPCIPNLIKGQIECLGRRYRQYLKKRTKKIKLKITNDIIRIKGLVLFAKKLNIDDYCFKIEKNYLKKILHRITFANTKDDNHPLKRLLLKK